MTHNDQLDIAAADVPLAAQQQMAMARPWDHADEGSIWEISGQRTNGTRFDRCLAMVIPAHITGVESPPSFLYIHPGLTLATFRLHDQLITAAEITHAQPLLLVDRDQPNRAYWDHDQEWLSEQAGASR